MIRLEIDKNEYLLFVPYEQRDRAKRIPGRRWDPKRRCWVIPRTELARKELLLEFGDELTSDDPRALLAGAEPESQAQQTMPANAADIRVENHGRDGARQDLLELVDRLTAKELEVQALQSELSRIAREMEDLRASPPAEGKHTASLTVPGLDDALLILVSSLFPADENIDSLVRALRGDADLPIKLARKFEIDLRVLLKDTDDSSLFDLISNADSQGLLSEKAVDLAHVLRKQRNRSAHSGTSGGATAILSTNLFCLAATCLLLNEMR